MEEVDNAVFQSMSRWVASRERYPSKWAVRSMVSRDFGMSRMAS